MRDKIYLFLTIIFATLSINFTYSQGCSDAGVCTINSLKPADENSDDIQKNALKVGAFVGSADHSILVYGSYLEYNRVFNDRFGAALKLTSMGQNGNDIGVFGISDVFVNANYRVAEKLQFTLGAKVPLSDASKTHNNLALPMHYQASLGTLDLIIGVGYSIEKLQIVAALQQPLTQNNNQFLANSYPTNSALRNIESTNKYIRRADVLLRVSYPFALGDKFMLTPSLLPIYHLSEDKYTNEEGVEKKIEGSQGLTFNGNIYLDYNINSTNKLQFSIGAPFFARESRPDGLTRGFVANLEYRIAF